MKYLLSLLLFFIYTYSVGQKEVKTRANHKYDDIMANIQSHNYKLARLQADTMYRYAVEDKDTMGIAHALQTIGVFANHRGDILVHDSIARVAGRLYESIGNYEEAILCYSEVAGVQRKIGNIDEAFKYARKGQNMLPKARTSKPYIFNSNIMSLLFNKIGKLDSAIHYELDVIKRLELTDSFRLARAYSNLASSFKNIGNRERERELLYKSYNYSKAKNLKNTRADILYKLAMYELEQGDIQKGKKFSEESLAYYNMSKNKTRIDYGYSAMALSYLKLGNIEQARIYIDSIANTDKITDLEIKSSILINKLNVYAASDPTKITPDFLSKVKKSVEQVGQVQIYEKYYSALNNFHLKKGNYKKAENYLRLSGVMRDSLTGIYNLNIVNDLEQKYEKEKKELQIDNLELVNAKQRQTLVGGGIALGLISLLSFFLFRLYSQVKSQKKIISKSLSEKDLLLREIHHRVKNNLQLVSSLLTLQSRSIDDEMAQQAIQEGRSRVRSMALIHQDLYNKENLTDIGVKQYIEKLTQELFDAYSIDTDRIVLTMDIQEMDIDVDTLVPLGLIINELITNSLKYAFPGGATGRLHVSLKEKPAGLNLIVKDNGIGYDPEDKRESSFGATLINALTEQLEGKMNTSTDNGTRVDITFANN